MIETIAFAFSIMGVVASVSSTMYFPLISGTSHFLSPAPRSLCHHTHCSTPSCLVRRRTPTGGHVGMVFGWLIPSLFVMTIAASLAELTSAMPYVPFSTNFDR